MLVSAMCAEIHQDYHGIACETASRWMNRGSHREVEMRSADSLSGPFWSFCCDFCRVIIHSTESRPVPKCSGGSDP